jgi:hypothetical protein
MKTSMFKNPIAENKSGGLADRHVYLNPESLSKTGLLSRFVMLTSQQPEVSNKNQK